MKKTYFQPETEIIDMVIENEILEASDLIKLDEDGVVKGVGLGSDDFTGGGDVMSRILFN